MDTAASDTERDERIAALMTANATAKRLAGTGYYDAAHRYLNELLDQLVGR